MKFKILTALLLSAFVISCGQKKEWKFNNAHGIYLNVDSSNALKQDSAMLSEIAPYKQHLDSSMNIVIAHSDKEYFKNKPNGTLNNIVCDMVFDVISKRYEDSPFKPDLCLLNYGGLRRPLPKGDIMISDIYQLMPFQNESVICRLSGKQMNIMFKYLEKTNGQPIANMVVEYNGGLFVTAQIDGKTFDSTKTYNVLTSDYTAKGGDHMDFFLAADTTILCESLLRNDIFDYIYSLKKPKLIASEQKRIIIKNERSSNAR
jgi:2',3'-cyclic-nucleotide 2'-phosphodiesterase (5'-nucleotidase family)